MIRAARAALEQDLAFVAPVDLGLRAGDHLEPAMQPVQARLAVARLGQPLAGLGDIELDPLVVPVEAVLGDQPLASESSCQNPNRRRCRQKSAESCPR